MRHRWITIAIMACAAGGVDAQELTGAARWADSARVEIEAAYTTADTARLGAARVLLERALTAFPDDALLLHYQGYALYREANLRSGLRGEDVGDLLESAEEVLERSAELAAMPETLALMAGVIGQRIGANPIRGMIQGPRSGRFMDRALERGPRNPRVWLLRGVGAMFTPRMFGGGLARAEEYLETAAELYRNDAPAPPAPAWGRGEVWAWLGQVYAQDDRIAEARSAYMKALEHEPDNAWVRDQLLPALGRDR